MFVADLGHLFGNGRALAAGQYTRTSWEPTASQLSGAARGQPSTAGRGAEVVGGELVNHGGVHGDDGGAAGGGGEGAGAHPAGDGLSVEVGATVMAHGEHGHHDTPGVQGHGDRGVRPCASSRSRRCRARRH